MSTQKSESSSIKTWLHLGASAFFRAHQAYYFNQLASPDWQMQLANLRNSASQDTLKKLKEQNGEYTLEIISPEGVIEYQTIRALKEIILWDSGLASTIKAGVSPSTKIISFTVTEGGYFLNDDGHLNLEHPAVHADLQSNSEIQTLYGALTQILLGRMHLSHGEITLLCCDNLRNNGDSFAQGLYDFIQAKQLPQLLGWVKNHVSMPNSMVDRITPKFENSIFERLNAQNITKDQVPLSCEQFTRWVIEDNFISERPNLEKVGVEIVEDVAPYEEAKIRLLNASHSGLAWAGALLNKTYINKTLSSDIVSIIKDYAQNDVSFSLKNRGINIDTIKECDSVLHRFKNPYVKDTVARVSSDSIAKLHDFIVPTLKDCFEHQYIPHSGLKLAALYFFFLERYNAHQLQFEYEDRALPQINIKQIFKTSDPIKAFISHSDLFGTLSSNTEFQFALQKTIEDLRKTNLVRYTK